MAANDEVGPIADGRLTAPNTSFGTRCGNDRAMRDGGVPRDAFDVCCQPIC